MNRGAREQRMFGEATGAIKSPCTSMKGFTPDIHGNAFMWESRCRGDSFRENVCKHPFLKAPRNPPLIPSLLSDRGITVLKSQHGGSHNSDSRNSNPGRCPRSLQTSESPPKARISRARISRSKLLTSSRPSVAADAEEHAPSTDHRKPVAWHRPI